MTVLPLSLVPAEVTDRTRVVVEWLVSSVCNYECSYCPVYLHDGRVRWPNYDDISRFCRQVRDHYGDRQITFLLSGGEITVYPHLARLARELRGLGIDIAILSNGSKPVAWWAEHSPLFDEVLLSYHHEKADPDHFVAVVNTIGQVARVEVNVVIDPAVFDETMQVAAAIETGGRARVHRKIMFLDSWRRVADYTPDQHRQLTEALADEAARSGPQLRQSILKGDLDLEFTDGSHRTLTPSQIIDADLNHWRDWTCEVGVETLFVRFDEIWRASCRQGGLVGSIFDTNLRLPDSGVRCGALACNCIAGIKTTKSSREH